jgi:hypothetical protein
MKILPQIFFEFRSLDLNIDEFEKYLDDCDGNFLGFAI